MTTIERDYAIIFNQRIERPENMVPGDWFDAWQAFTDPVNHQEAFEAGAESVKNDYDEGFSDGYEKAREDAIREIERMC